MDQTGSKVWAVSGRNESPSSVCSLNNEAHEINYVNRFFFCLLQLLSVHLQKFQYQIALSILMTQSASDPASPTSSDRSLQQVDELLQGGNRRGQEVDVLPFLLADPHHAEGIGLQELSVAVHLVPLQIQLVVL